MTWRLPATILSLMLAGSAVAHPGHDEPISRDQAVGRATAEIARLLSEGRIDPSWKLHASLASASQAGEGAVREWVVVFENATVAVPDKRTLYVFISETGEYLAANFTGR